MKEDAMKFMAVVSVLVLALFAGACGGGGGTAPTPITTPTPTATPAHFARVVTAIPASESAIPAGTRPQVTVEYALSGSYSDIRVYACLSENGGETYIMDTCSWAGSEELSGRKTVLPGEVRPGHTTNAIVPIVTAGSILAGDRAIIVRGAASPHTWVW